MLIPFKSIAGGCEDWQLWQASQSQFFEAWKQAVQTLRDLHSSVMIVGPLTVEYNVANWMDDLLTYAKNNNVLPDILSWHELVTSAADVSGFGEFTNPGGGICTVGQTFVSSLQADSGTKSTCQKNNIPTQYNNNGWGYESMS